MDYLSLLRTLGGLGIVLGILASALWLVRRYDLRLPGRTVSALDRRLELVETLAIDPRRTVALIRRDGREHVILIAPEGHLVLESAIVRPPDELVAKRDGQAERIAATWLREERRAQRRQFRAQAIAAEFERFAAFMSRLRSHCAYAIAGLGRARNPGAVAGAGSKQRPSIRPQNDSANNNIVVIRRKEVA